MHPLTTGVSLILFYFLVYFVMLGINNIVWLYKRIPIDRPSQAYKKRKVLLRVWAVPAELLFFFICGIFS